jgi:hypothetical protein
MTQPGARAPDGPTSFRPGGAFLPGCLSSVEQLPDTPGYPLDRSPPSALPSTEVAVRPGRSRGTSWPSRSYRSTTARSRPWPVALAHRSSAFPDAPQRKQCHAPRPRCAENDRLGGDVEPCHGHAPRTCSPRHWRGRQPSSPSTQPRRISLLAWPGAGQRAAWLASWAPDREEEPVVPWPAEAGCRPPQNRSSSNASALRHRW